MLKKRELKWKKWTSTCNHILNYLTIAVTLHSKCYSARIIYCVKKEYRKAVEHVNSMKLKSSAIFLTACLRSYYHDINVSCNSITYNVHLYVNSKFHVFCMYYVCIMYVLSSTVYFGYSNFWFSKPEAYLVTIIVEN